MKQKTVLFKKRYGSEHKSPGQKFTKPSVTIPGQDYTPQELWKRFRSGVEIPQQVYSDQNISQFERMSTVDKIDYLQQLKNRNTMAKDAISAQIKSLQEKHKIEELNRRTIEHQNALSNNANDATNVTNAK